MFNDEEISKLIHLNEDEVMKTAFMKLQLSVCDLNDLYEAKGYMDKNGKFHEWTNSQLGQMTRGLRIGRSLVLDSYKELNKFNTKGIAATPSNENTAI